VVDLPTYSINPFSSISTKKRKSHPYNTRRVQGAPERLPSVTEDVPTAGLCGTVSSTLFDTPSVWSFFVSSFATDRGAIVNDMNLAFFINLSRFSQWNRAIMVSSILMWLLSGARAGAEPSRNRKIQYLGKMCHLCPNCQT
jgi:hypothetical protein